MAKEESRLIIKLLDEYAISYRFYEHEPVNTMEECLRLPSIHPDVTFCKNVFLCNRQKTAYYLLLLCPETPLRTGVVSKALGTSRLSFAPEEALLKKLHLTSGAVSPLGLYFDEERRILLCYQRAVKKTPFIAFHPCDNRATMVFEQEVFWKEVLPLLRVEAMEIDPVE